MAPHLVRAHSTYNIWICSFHPPPPPPPTPYKYTHYWWWVGTMRRKNMRLTHTLQIHALLVGTMREKTKQNRNTRHIRMQQTEFWCHEQRTKMCNCSISNTHHCFVLAYSAAVEAERGQCFSELVWLGHRPLSVPWKGSLGRLRSHLLLLHHLNPPVCPNINIHVTHYGFSPCGMQ